MPSGHSMVNEARHSMTRTTAKLSLRSGRPIGSNANDPACNLFATLAIALPFVMAKAALPFGAAVSQRFLERETNDSDPRFTIPPEAKVGVQLEAGSLATWVSERAEQATGYAQRVILSNRTQVRPPFRGQERPLNGAETGGAEPHIAEQSRSWRAAGGGRRVASGRLCAVLEAPAFVAGLDDVAVVCQPVEQRAFVQVR